MLAEDGWKPHRVSLVQKRLSRASIYWYMREQQRGTVSSNSRFQIVPFQQHSAKLSIKPVPIYILQRGVQWKQGVVICMMLYTSLLCNTTHIHCTPCDEYPADDLVPRTGGRSRGGCNQGAFSN